MSTKLTERALSTIQAPTYVVGGSTYTIKRQVSRPVIPQIDRIPFFVTFRGPAHDAPVLKDREGRKVRSDYDNPPRIADVFDLETKTEGSLIMNAVLESELERNYPDHAYVGRSFAIVRAPHHKEDKRYKSYQIVEIEVADTGKAHTVSEVMDGDAHPPRFAPKVAAQK